MVLITIMTTVAALISWGNRMQGRADKAEVKADLAAMEVRLRTSISDIFVGKQAHDDLEKRVSRLEAERDRLLKWQVKEIRT